MKKSKLISLQCTGESVEKVISLYYYSLFDNKKFYNKYKVFAFYGHNLPKKEKKMCAQGTIGFYNKYYSKNNIIKNLNKKSIIMNKDKIIKYLIFNKKMSYRVALKYKNDSNLYWKYIKNLPFEYLFPNHLKKIISVASNELNLNIIPLYLEENLLEILLNITNNFDKYSIYALEYDGTIGRYYLKYNNIKSFSHTIKMLKTKAVLSGNSAILLEQVFRMSKTNYVIGYRNHSSDIRKNRNYVLSKLLSSCNSVVEPKIHKINELFSIQDDNLSTEEKANKVYAIAYLRFLKDYEYELGLNNIMEEWYEN